MTFIPPEVNFYKLPVWGEHSVRKATFKTVSHLLLISVVYVHWFFNSGFKQGVLTHIHGWLCVPNKRSLAPLPTLSPLCHLGPSPHLQHRGTFRPVRVEWLSPSAIRQTRCCVKVTFDKEWRKLVKEEATLHKPLWLIKKHLWCNLYFRKTAFKERS